MHDRSVVTHVCRIGAMCGWLVSVAAVLAQSSGPAALSLSDAIQLALKNYPAIKESRARAQAAAAGIGVARTAYLPHLDMFWQENRATTNNLFGMLFPQSTIFSMTGPVQGTRSLDNGVWGSAAAVLLSWEAVDFGQRKASVNVARAQTSLARNQSALTELDVASAAADTFLTVLAADESVRASQANVDRLRVFANTVRVLVQNQLRPGVDQSRAEAELAVANNQLSQAVQAAAVAQASFADAVGAAGTTFSFVTEGLAAIPEITLEAAQIKAHPAARAGEAAVSVVRARQRALEREYFPRITLQSTFAARGSGATTPGVPSFGNGLWLQVPNWGVAASVTFPVLESFSINARRRVETENKLAEDAHYERTIQTLTTQEIKARALLEAAVGIANNTPTELQAATASETQARARYQAGLAIITEVAEAQRLLAQAEADDAIARLGVWRALLAIAQARGDLTPFIEKTKP